MLSTEEFFESFADAGFLKEMTWRPSNNDAEIVKKVRLRAPTRDVLGGEQFSTDYSIEYPTSYFPGLKRNEYVTIDGGEFQLRRDPQSELDGTLMRAYLQKVR